MSIRAIILGLLLGLFVSAATYFNDFVIRQTFLIGNHLPIAMFGTAVILLLVVNPVLRVFGRNAPLRGAEIGVALAIGLAACGWPGSGYFRGFDTIVGLPAHWQKTKNNWTATNVMSYVPGASAELAYGHVQDWPKLVSWLRSGSGGAASGPAAVVWNRLSPATRSHLERLDPAVPLDDAQKQTTLRLINAELIEPVGPAGLAAALQQGGSLPEEAQRVVERRDELLAEAAALDEERTATDDVSQADHLRDKAEYVRREAEQAERHAARAALVALLDGALLPAPEGQSIILAGGRPDPWAVDTLLQGRPPTAAWSLGQLPWRAWLGPIKLWWSTMLLMGVAALCLTLIVHPQWSRRELLPYPIARFIEEAAERKQGAWLPEVARTKMFWGAFAALIALHSINGLHAWYPELPEIPLVLDFTRISQLFPNASRITGFNTYSNPKLFLSVVAFSFFLTTSVSFSLGVSQFLYLLLATFMVTQGSTLERDYAGAKSYNMLMFGAYLGLALMILYTGRRYYANVALSAVGGARGRETPGYAVWAARTLIPAVVLAVYLLKTAGLDWLMATLFILLALMIFVVMTRIVVETGAFFMQPTWLPVGILTALFGFESIGPTTYIVLGLASMLMVVDPREVVMPYLANGLQIAERTGEVRPTRIVPWMAVMLVVGFFVAGTSALYFQYRLGLASTDAWTREMLPSMAFDNLARFNTEAVAQGTLADATAIDSVERLGRINPISGTIPWMMLGLALVIGTAVARLRLPWWPLHPIMFLVWGTYPINQFAFSFLLGWLLKATVMRTSGAKGYHAMKPLIVGVIAGELFAALLWVTIGAVYFWVQGKNPVVYMIFPG